MSNFTKAKATVVAGVTALLVSACGLLPGGLLGSPPGATETISLHSGIHLDLFVPEGWYLKPIEEDDQDSPWRDPAYLVIDSDVLPESTFERFAYEKEIPSDLNPFAVGRGFRVSFEPYEPCAKAEQEIDDWKNWVADKEDANASTLRGGVGRDGTIASAREGIGWQVYYRSSLPAENGNCQLLRFEGRTSDQDPTPLADVYTDVAENSALG